MDYEKPSQGIALLLNFFLGLFGIDKFYVGRYDIGILQLILTFTVIGLAINIPLVLICTISLIIAILFKVDPFLYKGIEWAPVNNVDKGIAWIILLLIFLSLVIAPYRKKKYYDTINEYYRYCSICGDYSCNCISKSCSSCSKGMIPP
jgi:TM2 domain-containing membrane protein YozV